MRAAAMRSPADIVKVVAAVMPKYSPAPGALIDGETSCPTPMRLRSKRKRTARSKRLCSPLSLDGTVHCAAMSVAPGGSLAPAARSIHGAKARAGLCWLSVGDALDLHEAPACVLSRHPGRRGRGLFAAATASNGGAGGGHSGRVGYPQAGGARPRGTGAQASPRETASFGRRNGKRSWGGTYAPSRAGGNFGRQVHPGLGDR